MKKGIVNQLYNTVSFNIYTFHCQFLGYGVNVLNLVIFVTSLSQIAGEAGVDWVETLNVAVHVPGLDLLVCCTATLFPCLPSSIRDSKATSGRQMILCMQVWLFT